MKQIFAFKLHLSLWDLVSELIFRRRLRRRSLTSRRRVKMPGRKKFRGAGEQLSRVRWSRLEVFSLGFFLDASWMFQE